jgi:hypothetical protein
MNQSNFPPGWNEERVRRVLAHYEEQTEEEALAEDEAAFEDQTQTFMEIPNDLVRLWLFRKLMSYIVFMNDLKGKLEYTRQ